MSKRKSALLCLAKTIKNHLGLTGLVPGNRTENPNERMRATITAKKT